jgi:hypothetical protein
MAQACARKRGVKGKPVNGVGTQLMETETDMSQLAQRYYQQRDDVYTSPASDRLS